ncbi:MAG: hydroxymethylglutaryl-CoA lyase [Rhodospirillales bacterium]|nr:MAG: hydroxymethylglutaryl-CoA lyase [Rhodospirillales bacterium]
MYDLVDTVLIEDESLRDGLQIEQRAFSVEEKLHFIRGLEACGVRRIQAGSFVHPKWVPQMANTDELFARLDPAPGVTYTALVLNGHGLDRAVAAGVKHLSMSISASEEHSLKNTNRTLEEAKGNIVPMIERAVAEGIAVRAGIQSALGCGYGGEVPISRVCEIASLYSSLGVREINIADTAGLGNPRSVIEAVSAVRKVIDPAVAISLHLHDTRGLGLANMIAGLQAGVAIFDAALAGLGGCPFVPGAAGNIATEDAAYALGELGVETGIDWKALAGLALEMEETLQRSLPSRMARVVSAA